MCNLTWSQERIRKEKEEDRIRMEKEADEFAKALENQALKDATSPPTKASAKVKDNSPKTDGRTRRSAWWCPAHV